MLLNSLVIKLINMALTANTGSRKLLAKKSGRSFKLIGLGFSIAAVCDIDGYLINDSHGHYDVTINIPLDSATFLIDQDKLAVYKKICFSGDATLGRELLEIFSNLHLDGLYTKINSPILLLSMNKLADLIRGVNNYLKLVSSNIANSSKEYFMYETQDLLTKFEHDEFCADVDILRQRSEQLEQQIKTYKAPTK